MSPTFWLTLTPVAALLVTIVGEYRRIPPTRLESLVVTHNRLLNVPDRATVQVVVDGRSVQQASMLVMRITNTGKTAITTDMWDSPMEVQLASGTLISARQIAARPYGLRVAIAMRSDRVVIQPFLFNPGDIIDIQIICERMLHFPEVHARIRNVKSIRRRKAPVYNPGNGLDGAMVKSNKIMYFVVFPLWIGLLLPLILTVEDLSLTGRIAAIAIYVAVNVLLYTFLHWAVRRSRRWRPTERF